MNPWTRLSGLAFVCMMILSPAAYSQKPIERALNIQDAFASVAERAQESVVSITATHVEEYNVPEYEFFFGDPFDEFFYEFFGQPQPRKQQPRRKPRQYRRELKGLGTGVIINKDGYVLTNEHVIAGAQKVQVSFGNIDKPVDAEIIGKDALSDLALLRIKQNREFIPLPMGDSDAIRIGDWVVAVGSPFGLAQTVTVGVISAERQSIRIQNREYRNFIQTDAAINQGNSGGPLLNIKGEIVGINTAIFAPTGVFSGIGFAIPINNARDIIDELIEKGKVVRGWLGITIQEVTDVIASRFGLENKKGVLINGVMDGSPAQKGGLQRGDIIIEFNGKQIDTVQDLQINVTDTPPNTKVPVIVMRNKKQKKVTITTGERPSSPVSADRQQKQEQPEEDITGFSWEGMTAREVDDYLRRRFAIDQQYAGMVIVDMEQGSIAVQAGLMIGDCITGINLQQIRSLDEFKKAVRDVDIEKGIVFDIVRNNRRLYISYQPE
ncbi:MAG: Do family serine endopeptidase [Elusimicrobia bacterium]|nr:Do family serine endopeptidase [Elusimicrobiota bacterium]MBD3411721.1 Do family serine endopeptidase [Elusimicrobiota bacterium]